MANIAVDMRDGEEVPVDQLRRFYELMLLTRTFDSQAVNLQRQGRIGFHVPCEGEEAAEVGSTLALRPTDSDLPRL